MGQLWQRVPLAHSNTAWKRGNVFSFPFAGQIPVTSNMLLGLPGIMTVLRFECNFSR